MASHFILVDFENVQPRSLGALSEGEHQVRVFVGASQNKVSLELAQSLQALGPKARYVQIAGNGANALDFHIAYYIGRLSAKHPGASFTIISRDTGFDPLVKHLAAKGIACRRTAALAEAGKAVPPPRPAKAARAAPAKAAPAKAPPARAATPAKAASPAASPPPAGVSPAQLAATVERLVGLKSARPRTVKTLQSSLRSWFKPALDDARAEALARALEHAGKLRIEGTRVTYTLG